MKLTLGRKIDAPQATVFDEIAAFEALERMARDKGVNLVRTDDGAAGPAGATWNVRFDLSGRVRKGIARVVAFERAERIALAADLDDISALAAVDLATLPSQTTRLTGSVVLRPASMTGRVLLQTLKLARGSLERRLASGLDAFAGRLERRPE